MSTDRTRRLGRGLEALFPTAGQRQAEPGGELRRIPISDIRPNPLQPRREFDPKELEELASSIKASGLLQPVTVRAVAGGEGYELISGERRLRAVRQLGWTDVPAVIRAVDDQVLLTLAMIENLQRTDLNAVELAKGYRTLIDSFGMTQNQVAEATGKDRTTVTSLLRILRLPASVLDLVANGTLSAGHARTLASLESDSDIIATSNEVVRRHLNVRQLELIVRRKGANSRVGERPPARPHKADSAELRRIEAQLRRRLQTDVKISASASSRGRIEVAFHSSEDLDRLIEIILGQGWTTE